ncbi:FAD-dependent oxidoreductase [Persicobacter diffluens]|uniref:Amino oxidase n=1 Tax=Persicobacter diffluens TaxID=981 RepID=A0AAN4VY29_9BACT|nr:amino oxidase [Persicobacter diffluens]
MKRRQFLKISSTGLLAAPLWQWACQHKNQPLPFPVHLRSEDQAGHFLRFGLPDWPQKATETTTTLIVGGGMAGLSTACHLEDQDFLLLEMSDRLGGTASAENHQGQWMAQGAHYDVAYPAYYGEEVLSFLKSMNIIDFDPLARTYRFTDREHIVPFSAEGQYLQNGERGGNLIADHWERHQFQKMMAPFEGKMPMPARLIKKEFHYLNDITFKSFLDEHYAFSNETLLALSYAMRDDYGAGIEEVSALAGIHYFTCRPYGSMDAEIFSPGEGNYYFIKKMKERLPQERIQCQQMVVNIQEVKDGFETTVVDMTAQSLRKIRSANLVFAAPKFQLSRLFPKYAAPFIGQEYSPWLVINFVLKQPLEKNRAVWQNEWIQENSPLLGMVNSKVHQNENQQILSLYHNYQMEEREELLKIKESPEHLIRFGIKAVEALTSENIQKNTAAAYIHFMGHAMPLPKPGYLFKALNLPQNLAFAGVDCFRLPLLFEAMDSGIQAAQKLSKPSLSL